MRTPVQQIRRDNTLKDVAILNRRHDAVFRRDPGDRVLLLDPPSTEKTTTPVKRVGSISTHNSPSRPRAPRSRWAVRLPRTNG